METNNNEYKYICPKCSSLPRIKILSLFVGSIEIHCECGFNEIITINEYLNMIKAKEKIITNKCNIKHKEIVYYCTNCKLNICKKCFELNTHINHNTILIKDTTIDVSNQIAMINKGKEHIDIYIQSLKNNLINEMIKKINSIETAYEKCVQNNYDILMLLKLITNEYNTEYPLFNYQENIITNCNFNFSKIKDCDINYKKVHYYLKNFSLIKDNIFQSIQANQLKKSNHTITSLIVLQNGKIAVASDKKIIILNKVQSELILEGHTNNVSSLSLSDNDTIISCSIDGEIKIWVYQNSLYNCIFTYKNISIDLSPNLLSLPLNRFTICRSSHDIEIYTMTEPYKCLTSFKYHTNPIDGIVLMDTNRLISASYYDYIVCIWDIDTYALIDEIKVMNWHGISSISKLTSDTIFIGSLSEVLIISISKKAILNRINSYGNTVALLVLNDGNVLCGTDEGQIFYYNSNLHYITNYREPSSSTAKINMLVPISENEFLSVENDQIIGYYKY